MSRISRRSWIVGTVALAVVRPFGLFTSVTVPLTGCGPGEPEYDPVLRVPLAEIPETGRLERDHGRVAVELRRVDGEVRARSMFCSHQFCRVKWIPEENHYLCPCDDGLFAADGSVKYGRAKRPLKDLDVQIVGDEAWVDTRQIYKADPLPEETAEAR